MNGVAVDIQLDLGQAGEALSRLAAADLDAIADVIGQLVESQTQTRLSDERTSPEGVPWQAWSKGYAEGRHGGHSLLVGEGNLRSSVQNYTTGDVVRVGSNLVYAAIHQFGGRIEPVNGDLLVFKIGGKTVAASSVEIPARPWLGLSAGNRVEIEELVIGELEALLQ